LAVCLVAPMSGASYPSGLEVIFRGIEPGKKFYPAWPPMVGQSTIGIMIQAKDPSKPQGLFESIESGTFRNPQYKGTFETGTNEYLAPEYTSERNIGVTVAFSQLEAIAEQLNKKSPAVSVPTGGTSAPQSGAQQGTPQPSAPALISPQAPTQASNAKPDRSGSNTAATAAQQADTKDNKVTGVDFQKLSKVSLKPGKVVVEYYTYGTLLDINGNNAINAVGQAWLTPANKGFVIHRVLRLDNVEYTLDSTNDIEAGFFAKVVAWLPGVSVRYKNTKTLVLKSSAPIYIGYKLWRPGIGIQGAAATDDVDLASIGLGSDDIEKQFGFAAPGPAK
jgi:hypothetical protein